MGQVIQTTSVAKGSIIRKAWNSLFGPSYLPDAPPRSEDKSRTEAEGTMRLADDSIKAVDKLPEARTPRGVKKAKSKA